MEPRTYICLFDLKAYDEIVAPAMRLYTEKYDPEMVVQVLERLADREPEGDFKHWIDSIRPDKGYKPSPQTVQELCEMLIPGMCLPREPGLNPMQDADVLTPWLGAQSEWFADLMAGGEELAGGSLEFGFGTGRLVATREQVLQFRAEMERVPLPSEGYAKVAPEFLNLRKVLKRATEEKSYTLFKTSLTAPAGQAHPD
jgi:hypothetical protein